MSGSLAKAEIEIRKDGVYLIVKRNEGEVINRMAVNSLIESMGIQDVDFAELNQVFKSEELDIDVKISDTTQILQEPEKIQIDVSKDHMKAYISFIAPINGGKTLTKADIEIAVQASEVKFGIIEGIEERLARRRDHETTYTLAEGLPSAAGKDGYLEYNFDTRKKNMKPKVLEDGKVDFRVLNLIEMAYKDMLLVTAVPETYGRDGMNVLGHIIAQPKLKPAPTIPITKNTHLSQDGRQLSSSIAGQIVFDGKKVVINPVFEVAGDVGPATGNIEFVGSVSVKGNVVSGYKVAAEGDIDILGVVEGAHIDSRGDIIIARGVQGLEKAHIIADGSISLKFAENCTIKAGKSIFAEAVLHSTVRCGGRLELQGKNGYLVGGDISVRETVFAKTIGSSMGTATNIQVGLDPSAFDEYNGYIREYNQMKIEYDKIISVAKNMKELNDENALSDQKKSLFLKLLHQQAHLRQKMLDIKTNIDDLSEILSGTAGSITATGVLRSGVKVTIGDATMHIRDDVKSCVLRNIDSGIIIGDYKKQA